MAEKPINNALSNYDNEVTETANGKAGFVSNLLSGGLSLSSIKNSAMNLASSMTGKVGTFLSDGISKLNELASGLLGKIPGLDGLLGKLGGFLNSKLQSATNLLKGLLDDTLRQLENAALNFINNIIEDFTKNLVSTLFIPDEVFAQTIKSLYYSGADLAYDNHYIRNMSMQRDWIWTLKFIDEQYGIKYNYEYKNLQKDISTCASNSCANNLFYIYEKVIESIEEYKSERINYISKSNEIKDFFPDSYTKNTEYISCMEVIKQLDKIISEMEEMLVSNLKTLIVDSYTYVSVTKIKKFFTDLPGDYLMPKYFGTSDDKFEGKFAFSETDCRRMMPTFISHETTESDKQYLENVNNERETLKANAEDASYEADMYRKLGIAADSEGSENITDADRTKYKINEKIATLRENMNSKQADRYGVLSSAAMKSSNTVYQVSASRYSKQNDLPNSVKFKKNVTGALGTAAKNLLYSDTEYITLKNKNIKEIYILMSSNAIFGYKRMVNEAFYLRCKIPTMNALNSSLDKAKGILGTSLAVQGMFDLQDSIDRTAYDYTKKMEDYLLNPKVNIDDIKNAVGALTFQLDPSSNELVIDEDSPTVPTDENGVPLTPGSVNASNPTSVTEMNKFLDSNTAINQEVISVIRYISNIPMVTIRDTIIKWLTNFYNFMDKKHIAESSISHSFRELCTYVFASTDITDPSGLVKLFNSSTKESLCENIKLLVYIYKSLTASTVMKLENIEDRDSISNLFYICISMFSREISDIGFIKSLFEYDKEFLKTYVKSYYYQEIDFLKGINDKTKEDYKMFYPYKDKLTKRLEGFDKFGIFGYNENLERIQYTNIITGDWKTFCNTSQEIFFGGTDNTLNNGIKRLNADKTEVINTNIKDGNWINIFEYYGNVFFVKDTDELYYWDGEYIKTTGITDFSKWEITGISNYNVIMLLGKENNGLKRWNNGSFLSVVSTGDNWFVQKSSYFGYCIFPTNNSSNPVFVDSSKNFSVLSSLNNSFTYIGETKRTVTVTATVQPQQEASSSSGSGTTQEQQTVPVEPVIKTITSNAYYILFGTKTDGIKIYRSIASKSGSSLSEYTTSNSLKDISGIVIPNSTTENTMYYIRNDGEYRVTFNTSKSTNQGTVTDASLITINQSDLNLDIDEDTKIKNFTNVNSMILTKKNIIFHDTGANKNYNKIISTNTIYDFDSSFSLSSGKSYIFDPNDSVYWEYDHKKGIYKIENESVVSLMNSLDSERTGWKLYYLNKKLFAVNEEVSLGIRVLENGSFTNTNIENGIWILGSTNKRIFALSTKNSNKGIKVCNFNSTSNTFIDIPKNNITYGDYSGITFDSISNKLFIGAERSDLIMDLDRINYDIDSFIYPLHEYVLQKLIADIVADKLETLTEFIIKMIEDGKDMFIMSSVLIEKLMNITVNRKTLRETLLTITDEVFINKVNSFTNPLDKGRYILDNINKFVQLTPYETLIEEFLNINKNFVDVFGIMNKMEEFSRDMQRKSALFTELIVHSEAKKEFNMDDEKAIDSIIVDFLNTIKYNGNIEEYYDAIARYKGDNIKIYGLLDYDRDGKQITIDKNSTEYKREHYYDSDEFMNSDEDGSY